MNPSTPKILIVGAGPAGLVLALSLLKNGVPVRIIEKSLVPNIGQRGAGSMPRSHEVYRYLGVLEEIEKLSMSPIPRRLYAPPEGVVALKTVNMVETLDPTPSYPYVNPFFIGQDQLEGVLRSALKKYNCEVEFGTALVSFEQTADHVSATLLKHQGEHEDKATETFDWLVGTDGAKGVVRKQLGLSFLGESREDEHLVIGDVTDVEGLDNQHWHSWRSTETRATSLRPTSIPGLFSFLIAGNDLDHVDVASDPDAVRAAIVGISGRKDLKLGSIVWASHWRPNIRMVDKFGMGRVFVAGDAAHVHSPTGGQGLNSGIQDSFNLAWKLTLVHRKLSPPSLLESYNDERLPVIADMLGLTTGLLNRTFSAKNESDDTSMWKRGGVLLQLGVNYRWSKIVVDEQEGDGAAAADPYGKHSDGKLRAGDRAPDAPALAVIRGGQGSTTRLFDVFGSTHHTVLVFSKDAGRYASVLSALSTYPKDVIRTALIVRATEAAGDQQGDLVLQDAKGYAYDAYTLSAGCDVVVVRPDGVVGAIVHTIDGLKKYFDGIFEGKV